MSPTPWICTGAFTICQGFTSASPPSPVMQGEEVVGSSRVTGPGRSKETLSDSCRQSQWRTRTQTLSHILWHVCVCVCVQPLNCVWLFVIPWSVAYQAPLFMGFPRQEYWSGLPFPSPWDHLWLASSRVIHIFTIILLKIVILNKKSVSVASL